MLKKAARGSSAAEKAIRSFSESILAVATAKIPSSPISAVGTAKLESRALHCS